MHRAAAAASIALAFVFLIGAKPSNAPVSPCSTDTFAIDGSAVTVQLCVATQVAAVAPATHRGPVVKSSPAVLTETFETKGQASFVRTLPLDAAPSDEPSRTIDDVSLERIGLARTLHLTIEVRTAGVRLEHALLVPGAVTLK
ncbi:MAG: hypothetical protein IAI50_15355 [Candidatus Eremiobacteraeota bacterium]|nr:hypothetical protein [Candidatus Eremiobacteraeota bacterium]